MAKIKGYTPIAWYDRRARAIKKAEKLVKDGAEPLLVLHDLQCGGFTVHPVGEGEDIEFLSGKRSGFEIIYRTGVEIERDGSPKPAFNAAVVGKGLVGVAEFA